jgi:hypothetical protein
LPIEESLEVVANVTVERCSQPQKQPSLSILTDEGMQIDESDEQSANADFSIRKSLEPIANVTVERPTQSRKQFSLSTSTDEGMHSDESDEGCGHPIKA